MDKVPDLKIPGISSGQGSYGQVSKQITTKLGNGQIQHITGKTFGKMVIYDVVKDGYGTILGSEIDALQSLLEKQFSK